MDTSALIKKLVVFLLVAGTLAASGAFAEDKSQLGSVGLQVVPTASGELVVLSIPAGTPAAASGIKPGDLIVEIDDFPLASSDFAEVVSRRLWGPEGSKVVIRYLRPGEAGRKSVTLIRAAADPKMTVSPAVRGGVSGKGERP